MNKLAVKLFNKYANEDGQMSLMDAKIVIIQLFGKEMSSREIVQLCEAETPVRAVTLDCSHFLKVVEKLQSSAFVSRFMAIYDKFDRSHKGYINFTDFEQNITEVMPLLATNDFLKRQMFDSLDTYGIGKVTKHQFFEMLSQTE